MKLSNGKYSTPALGRILVGLLLLVVWSAAVEFNPLRGIPRTLVRGGIANSPLRGQAAVSQYSGSRINGSLGALQRLQRVDPTDVSPWSFSGINKGRNEIQSGSSTQSTAKGSLKVMIDPSGARAAGARWKLSGSTLWRTSGATATSLAAGTVGVEFKDISGWSTPAPQTAQIIAGRTTTLTAHYTLTTGSLKVTIEPSQARNASARWRPIGTSTWRTSGFVLSGLNPGSCAIEFKTITGWATPVNQTIAIEVGHTATASATYVRLPGTLKVNLLPAAVISAGAKWRLVGSSEWLDSGFILANVSAGTCVIEFKAVSGWRTPSNKNVTITSGHTTTATGTYTKSERTP